MEKIFLRPLIFPCVPALILFAANTHAWGSVVYRYTVEESTPQGIVNAYTEEVALQDLILTTFKNGAMVEIVNLADATIIEIDHAQRRYTKTSFAALGEVLHAEHARLRDQFANAGSDLAHDPTNEQFYTFRETGARELIDIYSCTQVRLESQNRSIDAWVTDQEIPGADEWLRFIQTYEALTAEIPFLQEVFILESKELSKKRFPIRTITKLAGPAGAAFVEEKTFTGWGARSLADMPPTPPSDYEAIIGV